MKTSISTTIFDRLKYTRSYATAKSVLKGQSNAQKLVEFSEICVNSPVLAAIFDTVPEESRQSVADRIAPECRMEVYSNVENKHALLECWGEVLVGSIVAPIVNHRKVAEFYNEWPSDWDTNIVPIIKKGILRQVLRYVDEPQQFLIAVGDEDVVRMTKAVVRQQDFQQIWGNLAEDRQERLSNKVPAHFLVKEETT